MAGVMVRKGERVISRQQFLVALGEKAVILWTRKRSTVPSRHAGIKILLQIFWEVA
jgi:hypothetical protein